MNKNALQEQYYRGNKTLPTGKAAFEWDENKIKEIYKCRNDILHFGENYFWAVTVSEGKKKLELYKPQKRLLKALNDNRFVITLASRQVGKALALDTPVPTPTGWTTMGKLKDNDVIFNSEGNPCKVIKAHDIMYDRPCYKVAFDNGEEIIADEEHLWFTQNRNERKKNIKGSVKTTKDIFDSLFAGSKKEPNHRISQVLNGVNYESKKLPISPYILGLWLGDGSSCCGQITVGKRDTKEIIENIKNDEQFDKVIVTERKNNTYTVTPTVKENVKTKSLSSLLRANNLLKNKHIPDTYMFSDRSQRLELLCGLIDSDGYISNSKYPHARFYNTNIALAKQVKELIESLGYKTTYRQYTPTFNGIKCTPVAEVVFYPKEIISKLNFKKNKIKTNTEKDNSRFRNRWIYIKNIEKLEKSVPVRCITVDSEDSLFLVGKTYIKTHNTTIMSIYALWFACFQEDKKVLIVANREDTAKEILRRIKFAYEMLPNWLKPGVENWGQTEVYFSNDSSIVISATSSTAARGMTINILIVDEMAFIPEHIMDEFWNSVIPVISSDTTKSTKIFAVSTPNGTSNLFYKLYTGAERGELKLWKNVKIDWNEIPGRGKKWREEMEEALARQNKSFAQEFGNQFIETGESAVDAEVIEKLRHQTKNPKYTYEDGHYKVWFEPQENKIYAIGVDVAEGIGGAASVAMVFDITDLTNINQVAIYHNDTVDPYHFAAFIYKMCKQWGSPPLLIERNGPGGQVVDALKEVHKYGFIVEYSSNEQKRTRLGIFSHTNTKSKAVTNMRYWMNSLNVVNIYDIATVQEMETFVKHSNGMWKKKSGSFVYDDRVHAMLWALFVLETDIASRYFDIENYDDRGKPLKLLRYDYVDSGDFKLDLYNQGRDEDVMPMYFGLNGDNEMDGIEEMEMGGWERWQPDGNGVIM